MTTHGSVKSAAVRTAKGVVVTGLNHADCLRQLPMQRDRVHEVQGFVTQDDTFVSRRDAYEIAERFNQLIATPSRPDLRILFSEDIQRRFESRDARISKAGEG